MMAGMSDLPVSVSEYSTRGEVLLDRPRDAPDGSAPDSSASARAGTLHEIINLADSSLLRTVRHQTANLIETKDACLAFVPVY